MSALGLQVSPEKNKQTKKNLRLAGKELSKFKASVGRANKRIANRFFFLLFFPANKPRLRDYM